MDYATILVHLDASRRMHQRLHVAIRLAQEFQATLVGLLAIGNRIPGHSAIWWMVSVTSRPTGNGTTTQARWPAMASLARRMNC